MFTALANTKFLIDERDGNFEPFALKGLNAVDINGATDVSGLTIGGSRPRRSSERPVRMPRSRR
ncbi:MAG: hypothetical protein QOH03_1767 [Kribbellaceae bacterium]|nr:hypothetical protein [Kribbellaceae bacterium]